MLRIRLKCATLKGISHREVLNAASREANGIKMLQRTRDSSQKQFVASTHWVGSLSDCTFTRELDEVKRGTFTTRMQIAAQSDQSEVNS